MPMHTGKIPSKLVKFIPDSFPGTIEIAKQSPLPFDERTNEQGEKNNFMDG